MAKKKNQGKKHRFKYAEPTTAVISASSGSNVGSSTTAAPVLRPQPALVGAVTGRNFSYVGRDLRRIAVLGGGLVIVELLFWYLFGHTSLGPTVYNLIKF